MSKEVYYEPEQVEARLMIKSQEKKELICKKKYEAKIDYIRIVDRAVFKIFSDFFNIAFQDKKTQKKYGLSDIVFLDGEGRILDYASLTAYGLDLVVFKYMDLNLCAKFNLYKSGPEVYFELGITSIQESFYDDDYIYKTLLEKAIIESRLKGAYLTMKKDTFSWEEKTLQERTLSDVYLPQKQMQELNMFLNVFKNNNELLRYLFVGPPGTGKTESCLALMNELNKSGVTVIKTPVCEYIEEKVDLAIMLKPSVIILDDLDLSLGSRESSFSSNLQLFLDILDGTDKLPKDVGIIATTNSAAFLDLAAQRPGRFHKVMLFDELTKQNISDIIVKSLRCNFGDVSAKAINVFINEKVVELFSKHNVTGAHIYNQTSIIKLKYDTMLKINKSEKELDLDFILYEITSEIKILDKIREQEGIIDKLSNGGRKGVAFGRHDEY